MCRNTPVLSFLPLAISAASGTCHVPASPPVYVYAAAPRPTFTYALPVNPPSRPWHYCNQYSNKQAKSKAAVMTAQTRLDKLEARVAKTRALYEEMAIAQNDLKKAKRQHEGMQTYWAPSYMAWGR
jgi:hypothetical protein